MPFPLTFQNITTFLSALTWLLCAAGGVSALVKTIRLRRRGVRGTAVVVAMHPGYRCRYAEIEFVTLTGRRVRTVLDEGAPYAGYEPGLLVPVLYDPDDPEHVEQPRRTAGRIMLFAIAFAGAPVAVWFLIDLFTSGR